MTPMYRYEYKIVGRMTKPEDEETMLNQLGAKGWELVAISDISVCLYLKRVVAPELVFEVKPC